MIGKALVIAVLAALVAVGWMKHEDRLREQDTLAKIASQIAGRPVAVRCPSFLSSLVDVHGEAGSVQFDENGHPADHTNLAPDTCRELRHFSRVDFSCLDRRSCGFG